MSRLAHPALLAPLALTALVLGVLGAPERVPWGDGPFLQAVAWRLATTLQTGNLLAFLAGWWDQVTPQPPLGYLPVVLGDALLGDPRWGGRVGAGLGLWLLLDGVARLVRARTPGVDASGLLLPLLAVASSPLVWLSVDQVGWDLFAAGAVARALAALVASRMLSERGPTLRFGAWMAAGFLTKYSFALFLWLPCLVVGAWVVARGGPVRGRALRNLGLAVALFGLVTLPWYAAAWSSLSGYLALSVTDPVTSNARTLAERFSAIGLGYYPLAIKDAWGWPGILLALWGAGFLDEDEPAGAELVGREGLRPGAALSRWLPMLSALGGVLALSGLSQALDRYALPALVGLAPALASVRRDVDRLLVAACFGLLFLGSALGFRSGAPATDAPSHVHAASTLGWPRSSSYVPSNIDVTAWRIDEALTAIVELQPGPSAGLLLPFDFHLPDVGVYLIRVAVLGLGIDLYPLRPPAFGPMPEQLGVPEAIRVLYAVDASNVRDPSRLAWLSARGFQAVRELELPGGRRGVVYRR